MLQCSKQKPGVSRFWSFEFGSLDVVSDFVLRISDFQLLRKHKKCHNLEFSCGFKMPAIPSCSCFFAGSAGFV